MADNARGTHVSPGVYGREIDLTYAVKSLGITTLGAAGETMRGPAFQPIHVENWKQFVETFGGTNPEKYKGSLYPKYELPYIAKSYLRESKQMEVVRVLGLSGYKAGPAWVITAKMSGAQSGEGTDMVVAVLRSRGHYEKYRKLAAGEDYNCACPNEAYDTLVYDVGEPKKSAGTCSVSYYNNIVELGPYTPMYSAGNDCEDYYLNAGSTSESGDIISYVSSTNYGRFTVRGLKGVQPTGATISKDNANYFEYPVSLNPADKDFILKVLGTNPQDGDAPLYVEALYDVALAQCISDTGSTKVLGINKKLEFYDAYDMADYCGLSPVSGLLRDHESSLTRKNLGQRFLADKHTVTSGETQNDPVIYAHPYDYATNLPIPYASESTFLEDKEIGGISKVAIDNKLLGQVFTVVQYTAPNGKKHYLYRYYTAESVKKWGEKEENSKVDLVPIIDKLQSDTSSTNKPLENNKSSRLIVVRNMADGLYYRINAKDNDVQYISCDLNNYKSAYRYASTPWIVSNLKGDFNHIELNKLFRFHTISDGDNSNYEVKISIENIRPDEGLFDVVVRDINDSDEMVTPLEKFSRCSLTPGTKNFIGYKIGTVDGNYEPKSKYITVEVAEGTAAENSCPAGFLGYPQPQYDGLEVTDKDTHENIINPKIKYNVFYDSDVKNRKQYFGLSNRTGVDIDLFTFKGNAAYIDEPQFLTQGFHLDSRLSSDSYTSGKGPVITVDGVSGYSFDTVSLQNRTTTLTDIPAIGSESLMSGSIYEYVDLRKFTVFFYGGFDGWDVYRQQRSNTDEFKMSKYAGSYDINSGEGYSFDRIEDPEVIGLNQAGITSDWYAYLAAYRQFANPEAVDINVFVTPGIDYVNNTLLVNEVIDMIEEERADSIYVTTTPDKPSGAGDYIDSIYTPDDVVYNLEDTEIDSNYTCTYYPWVKYFDADNNQYIFLPPTKDVVRNFAQTDNVSYSWFAPAGISRGSVDCVRARYITKTDDEDVLYEGRINPIKTFASDSMVKVWGQKNLQKKESQLNRISVRRLLLRMRKLVAIACRTLLFDPNDTSQKDELLSAITPILDNIRTNRGISDYKIEVDDSVEARDRLELPARIYFKPIGALEYIPLDFILTPEGLSFDNI